MLVHPSPAIPLLRVLILPGLLLDVIALLLRRDLLVQLLEEDRHEARELLEVDLLRVALRVDRFEVGLQLLVCRLRGKGRLPSSSKFIWLRMAIR